MERHGSRSQKGPYERKSDRKSFFSKMKDSFRDYVLVPSWLSGSDTPMKDKTGSKPSTTTEPAPSTSSGYLGVVNSSTRQFQSQTMGMPNGQLDYAGSEQPQVGNVEIPLQSQNLPPPISEFTSSLLPLNRLTEKSDSVLANDDTMSQKSDASKSTSGCSSMVPQLDSGRRDSGIEKRKATDQETQGSRSPPSPGLQPTAKRPRMNVSMSSGNRTWTQRFNETVSSHPARSNLKRPAFNPSLFGSPLNDTSVLGTSFHESSFYSGKTVFGGRSSFRSTQKQKIDLNQSLPSRLTFPVKSFVKAKPRSNPVREAVTSSTAKRILDVLDRMPTPLADAKKIPVSVPRNWTQSPSFFSKEMTSSSIEPPTRRQTIAVLADISKNRQTSSGPKSQLDSVTKPVTSSFAAVGAQGEETASSSASGKMRREKSYHRGSSSVKPSLNEEDTFIIAPTLRTDFTLPVASIPKFNFATPSSKQPSTQMSKTSMPAALNFTFSSPIVEKVGVSKQASPQIVGGFQFSSPISLDKKDKKEEPSKNLGTKDAPEFNSPFSSASNMKMNFSTAPKAKANINGPVDSGNGGFKPANELRQGSVMDILGGSSSTSSLTTTGATTSAPLSTLFKQSGWTCDTCLISNKAETNKCIACQSPKPGPKQQNGTTGTPSFGSNAFSQGSSSVVPLSALFKQSGWSCDVCLVNNKEDAVKCLACAGPKPGAKQQTGQSEKPSLLSKTSVLPGNWVCKSCLIQNKAEDNVCGACKASKSGDTSPDASKQNDIMLKFKPLPGQWDCEVCLIQNKSDANNCLACQSPKPLKCFKPPPGDWECDTCLVNNKEKDVKCVACGYSRPGPPRTQAVPNCAKSFSMSQPSGFSFTSTSNSDSSKEASSLASSGFKFGPTDSNTSAFKFGAPPNSEISSKKAESGFKFGSASETVPATSGFKFGAANSSESLSNKSGNLISTGGFKFGKVDSSDEKKLTSDNSIQKVEEKNTSSPIKDNTATPSGGFKFGVSASQDKSKTNTTSTFGVSTSRHSASVGGFQFGFTSSVGSMTSCISHSLTSSSVLSNSISATSSQTVVSAPAKTNSLSLAGSFTLPTSQGAGGFNVTSNSSKDINSTPTTSSTFTGFAFGGSKASEATPKTETQKIGFGGLNTDKPVVTSTPAFGGFNFAQKKDEGKTSANTPVNNSENVATKRGRDEDQSETATKKGNYSFGSNNASSTPFQFGAAAKSSSQSSSSPFVFGQQNSTTTTTQAGGFPFNMNKSVDASKAVFGAAKSSTPTTSAAPLFGNANAMFGFTGQKTEQPSNTSSATINTGLFNSFGGSSKPTAAPAAVPTTFNFGGANTNSSTFGTGSGNAFGGNAPSSMPAFGATTPVFGSTNTGTVPTATPAFGGGVFQFGNDKASAGPQPSQTPGAVFQFGGKPPENAQPVPNNAGFNFNAAAQAGLGSSSNFNFSPAAAPGSFAFSASSTPGTGERKIKKAVRKLRR